MIEGSGAGAGSLPLTNWSGSGSRRHSTKTYGSYSFGSGSVALIKTLNFVVGGRAVEQALPALAHHHQEEDWGTHRERVHEALWSRQKDVHLSGLGRPKTSLHYNTEDVVPSLYSISTADGFNGFLCLSADPSLYAISWGGELCAVLRIRCLFDPWIRDPE